MTQRPCFMVYVKGVQMQHKDKKRLISILLFITIIFVTLSSCTNATIAENDKIIIVATIFPQYDFAKQIAGDNADVSILLAPGTESHTYEPTIQV